MEIPTLPTIPKLTCGVSVNLNNLKGELDAKLNAVLDLDLGTPAGLASIKASIEGTLSDIAAKVGEVVVIPPVMKSLRGELAELAALPMAGLAAAAKIVSIAEDYAGALGLTGFGHLNLNDLSKSVFSLSGSFDPCNMSVPNILKDPSGAFQKLPSIQPVLGGTEAALSLKTVELVTDSVKASFNNNTLSVLTDSVAVQMKNIESNISSMPQIKLPDEIPALPSGKPTVEDDGSITEEMKNWSAEDSAHYIRSITKLYGEGKVGPQAVFRAAALKKYHAHKLEARETAKVTKYAEENPEFNDPNSDKYHMMWGRFPIETETSELTGNTIWTRV
jgi:hypothetical protein